MNDENKREVISAGLTMGSALALVMSWGLHHSILLAIAHGLCSWAYVIVWAL